VFNNISILRDKRLGYFPQPRLVGEGNLNQEFARVHLLMVLCLRSASTARGRTSSSSDVRA
jgi:hypothetical protein